MVVIIPTGSMGETVRDLAEPRLKELKMTVPDKSYFKKLVDALAKDYVFNSLRWTVHQDNVLAVLNEIPWWPENGFEGGDDLALFCQDFYIDYLEPINLKIGDMFRMSYGEFDEDSRWRIWYSMDLNNDLIFERGEDYRIVEWMRLTDNGRRRV